MGLFSCMKTEQRPNIIYILADDLGYGELGVYGQEIIETPVAEIIDPEPSTEDKEK